MKYRFASMALLAVVLFSHTALAANTHTDKQKAWTAFRTAFLNRNFEALSELTRFPLEVKGILDDMPQLEVSRSDFKTCLSLLYLTTHESYIRKTLDLDKVLSNGQSISKSASTDGFRIGDLQFSKEDYRLQRIYLDTSELAVLKKCGQGK